MYIYYDETKKMAQESELCFVEECSSNHNFFLVYLQQALRGEEVIIQTYVVQSDIPLLLFETSKS